jgi:WD40 repeat protein
MWDVETGQELCSVTPPPYQPPSFWFNFTPDGQFLVMQESSPTLPERNFIRFWSIGSRTEVGRIEDRFWTMETASDGRTIANLGSNYQRKIDRVMFWSSPGDGPPRLLREFRVLADGASFSPDLSTMASYTTFPADQAKSTEMSLWDMATGLKRCSFAYQERDTSILNLVFLDNGRLLVACGVVRSKLNCHYRTTLWDMTATPRQIGSFSGQAEPSFDAQWLAVPHENGATLYKLAGMQEHGNLTVTGDSARLPFWCGFDNMDHYPSLFLSPDSRFIAVVHLYYDAPKPPLITWMPGWMRGFFPDELDNSVVRLWETETGKQHAAFFQCRYAYFSPDAKTLATVHSNGIIKLWTLPLSRPLVTDLALSGIVWLVLVLVWQCVIRMSRRGMRHERTGVKAMTKSDA